MEITGTQLKTWRESKQMTQAQAAALLGVTQPTLSRWEDFGDQPLPKRVAIELRQFGYVQGAENV